MTTIQCGIISGSLRKASFNSLLANFVAQNLMQHTPTIFKLNDYDLPLYNADLEATQFPDAALKLQSELKQQQAFIFCCPEYNSGISPALKNAIDWVSRDGKGGGDLSAYTGKSALLLSASPGGLGGIRGLNAVRSILGNIGVHVYPEQLALAQAHQQFDDDGILKQSPLRERLHALLDQFMAFNSQLFTNR